MFGGEEWEFRRPVLVGDTITAQRRLGAVEEKDGRSGPFVLIALRDDVHQPARRGRRRLAPRGDRPMSGQRAGRRRRRSATSSTPAIRNASRAQLFLYSAATHNPHRIHYDRDYALTEGHPDIIVHGPLQGAWLSQYVTDWAGPRGRMLTLTWQNRRSALPEHDYTFRGTVRAVDGDVVAPRGLGRGRRRHGADAGHGLGAPAPG